MRMPWVPRVQSRGSEAEVKFVRRVMELERFGSSEWLMGEKRWSSNALLFHESTVSWCVDTAIFKCSGIGRV